MKIYGTGQKKLGDFCIFPLLDNATVCSWPRSCLRIFERATEESCKCGNLRIRTYVYVCVHGI